MAASMRKRYLLIGNGASGTYAAETIRKTDSEGEITLLTNEPYPLYNRVALPPFLRDEANRLLDVLTPHMTRTNRYMQRNSIPHQHKDRSYIRCFECKGRHSDWGSDNCCLHRRNLKNTPH